MLYRTMVRVYSALRKTIEFRKSKNQGKGIITMSENPNSLSDSPLSDPENFGIPRDHNFPIRVCLN